jgi:hypothetical protein
VLQYIRFDREHELPVVGIVTVRDTEGTFKHKRLFCKARDPEGYAGARSIRTWADLDLCESYLRRGDLHVFVYQWVKRRRSLNGTLDDASVLHRLQIQLQRL